MVAAEPLSIPFPTLAIQAAPIEAIERSLAFNSQSPLLILSATVSATNLPWTPAGIPVLGGAGAIGFPVGVACGREIAWGGANAIPAAKTFP